MLARAPLGARLLAATLALTMLPAIAVSQNTAPPLHPWKLAYARRLADEGMEERRARHERADAMRGRQPQRSGKSAQRARGEHVRPVRPEDLPVGSGEARTARRASTPFGSQAFAPPVNRVVNNRAGDSGDSGQSETSIAAFDDRMVAAWNDGQGFLVSGGDTQGWATSVDGGLTWTDRDTLPSTVPGVTQFVWTSDPVVTVNEKSGAFYYSGLCDFSDVSGARSGVAVVKGRWNGNTFTWGTPVIARSVSAANDFVDKEWVLADSVSNRVFLSYSRFPNALSRIEFQWADSSLNAFSAPQMLSLDIPTENGFVQASRPVVDGDGRLYVMYYLIGQGDADFYRVCRSNNGGLSFTAPVTAQSLFTNFGTGAPAFNRPIGIQFAGVSVDRSHGPNRGRLYLSWAESIDWLDDVFTLGQSGNKTEVEPNGLAGNATPASLGQTLRGSITTITDLDLYALPLVAGQHLIAGADSCQSGNELSLRLFATDGSTQLTFTTFDATVNSTIVNPQGAPAAWLFTAPTSGVYYLRIASRIGVGSYRIRLGLADVGNERGRDQRDAFVAWSDNGSTWSTPTRINSEAAGFDDWLPEVAVTPTGVVYCAWYDFHDAATAKNGGESSLYLARSGDGGDSWTTLGAVSDTLSAWSTAPSNIEPNQGDYISLFATSSALWPCWADARRGNPDVFTARIPLIGDNVQVAFPLRMSAPRPEPVTGSSFVASFSLATDEPADLILFDISGREVFRQHINGGQGPQALTLPVGNALRQGLYVLTLRQGGHNASTRVHLVR